MCHRFWWHICFFPAAKANAKKAKEPSSKRTKTAVETDKQATTKKNNEGITLKRIQKSHRLEIERV
jgi:Tfp pilus assembly major pilin PilA